MAMCQLSPAVALLEPWVAGLVVAVPLPEAGLIGDGQRQPAHLLGALPEVQVRDQQSGRTAVPWGKRLAAELVGHPRAPAGDVLKRQVAVAAV
jgi:hypothetical protein